MISSFRERVGKYLFCPLFLFWWLCLVWTYSFSLYHVPDDWKNILLYMGAGLLTIHQALKQRKIFQFSFSSIHIFLLFYGLLLIISSLFSKAPYESWLEVGRVILWIGLGWSLSCLKEKEYLWIIYTSTVSAAIAALINLLQLNGIKTWDLFLRPFFSSNFPPIGHISFFGSFMAVHVAFGIFLVCMSHHKLWRFFWAALTLIILMGLWISGTRSAIVGLLSTLIISFFLFLKLKWISWKQISLALTFIAVIFLFLHFSLNQTLRGVSTTSRLSIIEKIKNGFSEDVLNEISGLRWSGYKATLLMIQDKPLIGWGAGAFRFAYPRYDAKVKPGLITTADSWYVHPHNEILNQCAENGVIGLSFFLGFWFLVWWRAWVYLKSSNNKESCALVACGLMGSFILFMTCQLDTNYTSPLTRLLIAFCVAMMISQMKFEKLKQIKSCYLVVIPIVCTFFLSAYHYSLYAIQKAKEEGGLLWSRRAFVAAPLSLESLYTFATHEKYFGDKEHAEKAMELLYNSFPDLPFVGYEMAHYKLSQGRVEEAKTILKDIVVYAPRYEPAQNLLKRLP